MNIRYEVEPDYRRVAPAELCIRGREENDTCNWCYPKTCEWDGVLIRAGDEDEKPWGEFGGVADVSMKIGASLDRSKLVIRKSRHRVSHVSLFILH